jgi:ornithine cyclodeaminase|tara:strand:+ start:3326 stop:4267 length:942 start_codon:yes stop_codon:yes gene_type:complete
MISAADVQQALDFPSLVERLRQAFKADIQVPLRHHHTLARATEPDATLLLMPAWDGENHVGVKMVTVTPGNADRGLPAVMGIYVLMDGKTGQPLALVDGPMLTLRRTAAASALAADYLAAKDTEKMLMVGTGALAPHLIEAHAAVRPIRQVTLWGRNPEKARKLAQSLSRDGLLVEAAEDLEAAVKQAQLISCATLSTTPLVKGDWLQPGQHLDLVGAFTPQMREADDAAVAKAQVFVDTREGATKEGGEIVQALASGALRLADIRADLHQLTRQTTPPKDYGAALTLFKSAGTALEDLAAAQLAVARNSTTG